MSELNDMGCAEFADVAAELALGVLTGRERAEALKHLDHCQACRTRVRQLTMTGEQLLELLPSREPPAGFETQVMDRLGIGVPEQARPGRTGRTGRFGRPPRRLLAAAAVAAGIVAGGAGGWGLHAATATGTSPSSPSASAPLSSAALLTAGHQAVGEIFYYHGSQRWIYMSADVGAENDTVTCQLVSADGNVTTVGSFRLTDGYGAWGGPATVGHGTLAGARLVASDGTVLATATLPHGSALCREPDISNLSINDAHAPENSSSSRLPWNCAVSTVA